MADTFTYVPSTSYSKTFKPRVRVVSFGGGYSQRVPDSINNIDMEWSLQFTNRPYAEANALIAFLEDKQGAEAFLFTPVDEPATEYKVTCDTWSSVATSHLSKTISCTFKRVYE